MSRGAVVVLLDILLFATIAVGDVVKVWAIRWSGQPQDCFLTETLQPQLCGERSRQKVRTYHWYRVVAVVVIFFRRKEAG